jgi:hypothetical protein
VKLREFESKLFMKNIKNWKSFPLTISTYIYTILKT